VKKKSIRAIIKLCAFFIIVNLPFLTVTYLLGIDTFIDSFNHPNAYQYIKNDILCPIDKKGGYIILEKSTYQGFSIKDGDIILYYTINDTVEQRPIYQKTFENGVKTYYPTTDTKDHGDGPIYDYQIIGKIKGSFDENIWNTLCVQIWDISIDNLNAAALFANP